jgi:hypothetical protein
VLLLLFNLTPLGGVFLLFIGDLMETLCEDICLLLEKTGVTVRLNENIPGCLGKFNKQTFSVQLARGADACILAHESVHWLQKVYRYNKIRGVPGLEGLDPLVFNPNLPHTEAMSIIETVNLFYRAKAWEEEIPAFALEKDPEKVLLLLQEVAEKLKSGRLKRPKPFRETPLILAMLMAGVASVVFYYLGISLGVIAATAMLLTCTYLLTTAEY